MSAGSKYSTPLKIINIFGDRGRYAGQVNYAPGREIHFWKYYFDDYISLESDGRCLRIDREKLDETISAVYSSRFDAASCDSPDALLIQYCASKKGVSKSGAHNFPFIINEVDKFEMAGMVRRFINCYYSEDPFIEFIRSSNNHWMHIIKDRRDFYTDLGIPESNLYYLPMCTASIEFVFPDFFASATGGGKSEFAGKIIAAGSHDRDYATLVQAAEKAGVEVHIITNPDIYGGADTPYVTWRGSLPEPEYMRALRDARAVVVPLLAGPRAAGQMACAIPMKFGTPVLTAASESTADLIAHGETGFTYPPGSVDGLAEALRFVDSNPGHTEEITGRAMAREQALSRIAAENISRLTESISKR